MTNQVERIKQIAETMHKRMDSIPTKSEVFLCAALSVVAVVAALAMVGSTN